MIDLGSIGPIERQRDRRRDRDARNRPKQRCHFCSDAIGYATNLTCGDCDRSVQVCSACYHATDTGRVGPSGLWQPTTDPTTPRRHAQISQLRNIPCLDRYLVEEPA